MKKRDIHQPWELESIWRDLVLRTEVGWSRRRRWSNGQFIALAIFCKFLLPYENPDNPQSIRCSLPILISLHQHPIWSRSHFHCLNGTDLTQINYNCVFFVLISTKHGCEVGRVAQKCRFLAETPFSAGLCQALDQLDPWRTSPPAETTLLFTPSTFLQ